MVIWLYTIFSNEAALLPFFLRHYAPLVERMVFFDNGSTDNSADLIRGYHHTVLRNYPTDRPVMDSINMAAFFSEQYKEARGYADYVLCVDCDEFLWSSPIGLRELLRGYKQQNIRAVKSIGYQMVSNTFPESDAPLVDQIRYGIRDAEYDKVAALDPNLDVTWRPGRHVCNINGAMAHQGEVKLLHYRYLGADYFQRRNAYNYGNLSAAEKEAGRSYHAAPNHQGKYSAAWYQQAQAYASDVVSHNLIEV